MRINSNFRSFFLVLILGFSLGLVSCGDYDSNLPEASTVQLSEANSNQGRAFNALQQDLNVLCKSCHVPAGVARQTRLLFDSGNDYQDFLSAWRDLGKGVETSLLATKTSGEVAHDGDKSWIADTQPRQNLLNLLSEWELGNTACGNVCQTDSVVVPVDRSNDELLGNPGKRMWANVYCENKPDSEPLSWELDPRRLLQKEKGYINNDNYAVYFNKDFVHLHTDALFENQKKQNEILVRNGVEPYHTAKREPDTCGAYRQAIQRGMDFLVGEPTTFDIFEADNISSIWKAWGVSERPDDFEEQLQERYGLAGAVRENPYPLVGENPAQTNGGSGLLPQMFVQSKDEDGKYNGRVGFTCLGCHVGRLGEGEVQGLNGNGDEDYFGKNKLGTFIGLPNTLQDLTVFFGELFYTNPEVIDEYISGEKYGPSDGWSAMVLHGNQYNRSRGVHAADNDIVLMALGRAYAELNQDNIYDFLTEPFYRNVMPSLTNGDQDPPPWWWLHNKTSYLWSGIESNDSVRGNMYFGHVNQRDNIDNKKRESVFEDLHVMTLSLEAPDYPGEINEPLARQGAILFHEKNLWAQGLQQDAPKPKGNGSCASCHGVYAPKYANDKRFLPDPRLIGMASHKIAFEELQTDDVISSIVDLRYGRDGDEAATETVAKEQRSGFSLAISYQRYYDSKEGFLDPFILGKGWYSDEEIAQGNDLFYQEDPNEIKIEDNSSSIMTPPLHGVWASAPYFHNGSVPSVWAVLKPQDRPNVWLRQQNPVGTTGNNIRGFDTSLNRAYNFSELGWNYQQLVCDPQNTKHKPHINCEPSNGSQPEAKLAADIFNRSGNLFVIPNALTALLDFIGRITSNGFMGVLEFFVSLGVVEEDESKLYIEMPKPSDVARKYSDDEINERMIYNTNNFSHKNTGHEWTKVLTDEERLAILEYLKVL